MLIMLNLNSSKTVKHTFLCQPVNTLFVVVNRATCQTVLYRVLNTEK